MTVEEKLESKNPAINFSLHTELIVLMGQIPFGILSQRPSNVNDVETTKFLCSQEGVVVSCRSTEAMFAKKLGDSSLQKRLHT